MKRYIYTALVATLLLGGPALANEDGERTAVAKQHYKLGLEAYKRGNYPLAIKELKKAYVAKKLPALLLNLGATYNKLGDLANAVYYYKEYLVEAPNAKDRGDVEKLISELEGVQPDVKGATPPAGAPASEPAEPTPPKVATTNAPSAPVESGKTETRSNLDDEKAPLAAKVEEPKSGQAPAVADAKSGPKVKRFGGAFYAGLAFAAVGVAGLGVGFYGLAQAKNYADVLSADSGKIDPQTGQPYLFNDPKAQPYDDKTVQERGKFYNTLGVAMSVVGAAALVGGIALIAADQTTLKRKRERAKMNAWLTPAVTPNGAGFAAGGRF